MDRQEVIQVLESLANGVDPATGAQIPQNTFHSPDVIRALFAATSLLKGSRASANAKFTSAGTPWSAEEDLRLTHEFDGGMTVSQIALQHGRSSSAISLRLVKLGKVEATAAKPRERASS